MPLTIDAPVVMATKVWTVAQLAKEFRIDRSNAQRYVTRLADNGHVHFRGYNRGDALSEIQRSVVVEFRRLSKVEGKRGDGLWRAIKDFPRPPSYRQIALAEVCDRYGVSTDQVDRMVREIMEIFEQ